MTENGSYKECRLGEPLPLARLGQRQHPLEDPLSRSLEEAKKRAGKEIQRETNRIKCPEKK